MKHFRSSLARQVSRKVEWLSTSATAHNGRSGGFLDQLIWLTSKVYNWIISVDLSWIIIPSLSISTTERLLATISGLLLAPEAVSESEWLCTSYQETGKSCYVSKDSLLSDAVAYLKVQDNTVERRHFFETLGCYRIYSCISRPFYDQKISPKNRPRLIYESYTKT